MPAVRPLPETGQGEVLIKVEATGVNRPDVLQRQGLYPPLPGVTDIPGLEVAGRIAARGASVFRRRGGERVCTRLLAGGSYAGVCIGGVMSADSDSFNDDGKLPQLRKHFAPFGPMRRVSPEGGGHIGKIVLTVG